MLRALIIDHAGVMTTSLSASWDIWNAQQGLAPGAWRRVLHDDPEGRRLYVELEHGRLARLNGTPRRAPCLTLTTRTT
ncbi:hypothetical protein ACWEKM_19145 [Streptomyces sp. NPDC004752]